MASLGHNKYRGLDAVNESITHKRLLNESIIHLVTQKVPNP